MYDILSSNQLRSIPPFTKRRSTRQREVTVQELIQSLPVFASRNLNENIEIEIIEAGQELPVMVDVAQIERALLTFIENAREKMPGGGYLTITTGSMKFNAGHAHSQSTCFSSCAFISISDTGSGMDDETLMKIFEPGSSAGERMGLPMAYHTIKQHNGSINLESKPGRGTTVKIYLPLLQKRPVYPERIPLPSARSISMPMRNF